MRQKTVKLTTPVEWAGQTYTQLTLRKLKVKHMLEVDFTESAKNPILHYAALAAASAAVDLGVIHELDLEDFNHIQEIIEGFFNPAEADKGQ